MGNVEEMTAGPHSNEAGRARLDVARGTTVRVAGGLPATEAVKNKNRAAIPPQEWKLAGWEGGLAPLKIQCHSRLNSQFGPQISV